MNVEIECGNVEMWWMWKCENVEMWEFWRSIFDYK